MSTVYYKAALERATKLALFKLEQKKHRGAWENMGLDNAAALLRGEVRELIDEISLRESIGSLEHIALECADVINYATIILDLAVREAGREPQMPLQVTNHGQWMDGDRCLALMWKDQDGNIWYELDEDVKLPPNIKSRILPPYAERI